MACHIKLELMDEFVRHAHEYSKGVRRLRDHAREIPRDEFMRFWELLIRLRHDCESAQQNVERHIAEHRC